MSVMTYEKLGYMRGSLFPKRDVESSSSSLLATKNLSGADNPQGSCLLKRDDPSETVRRASNNLLDDDTVRSTRRRVEVGRNDQPLFSGNRKKKFIYIKNGFECIEPGCTNRVSQPFRRCRHCAAIKRNADPEYRKKQSIAQRGKKRSKEARMKMSLAQRERFKDPEERKKCGRRLVGKANGMYKDGRTTLAYSLRHCKKYEIWRKAVFERDNYTCQLCKKVGGELEAHHIRPFSIILEEFLKKYSQFSPVEDKEILFELGITYKPFWDINNGITLCRECHYNNYTTRPDSQKIE